MTTVLIFLILAAIFGYVADKKLDENPDLAIPATAISIVFTLSAILLLILNRNIW
jgi:hypothetical protein